MKFIHERHHWTHFTWDTSALCSLLANVRNQQGRLLGRMEHIGFSLRTEASLTTLTADVTTSSAIEGEHLDPAQVRSSIARRLGIDLPEKIKAGRDVEGVVEMMLDATQNYNLPLTKNRLFAWHASLFPTGRSGLRKIAAGKWRDADADPMQVVSGPIGSERVHYIAPAASRIPGEIQKMLAWFNAPEKLDPVLKAAIAHFWFVTLHPFEDGNGRISRAIADMALARAEGTKDRFYSMSSQIVLEKRQYYENLERSQRGTSDITSWLVWFLGCLGRAIQGAETQLETVLRKARVWKQINQQTSVNERQRNVINLLLDGFEGNLTSTKYAKMTGCSADTALRDIESLVALGILTRSKAGGRGTHYTLSNTN